MTAELGEMTTLKLFPKYDTTSTQTHFQATILGAYSDHMNTGVVCTGSP